MASAFELRTGEPYLSANWLEYFDTLDLTIAVNEVRKAFLEKGYRLRQNGRFAVFNAGAAETAAREATGRTLHIEHLPLDDDKSHAGVSDTPRATLPLLWSSRRWLLTRMCTRLWVEDGPKLGTSPSATGSLSPPTGLRPSPE